MIEELQSGQRNKLGLLIIKQKKLNSENKRKARKALIKRKTLGRVIYPRFTTYFNIFTISTSQESISYNILLFFLLDDKNDMLKFV